MTEHSVLATPPEIRYGMTGIESMQQNIRVICSLLTFSVPLDRAIGLEPEPIDRPYEVSQALIANQVITAVEEFEPRVQVTDITFEQSEDDAMIGKLLPRIHFVPREGVE